MLSVHLDEEQFVACQAMAVVGTLREVAEAIDAERDEHTDAC